MKLLVLSMAILTTLGWFIHTIGLKSTTKNAFNTAYFGGVFCLGVAAVCFWIIYLT